MAKTKNNSTAVPIEKFDLKKLSWVFILILGAGLFYALTLLPSSNGPQPTFHVASRYIERGTQETGFFSLGMAVQADYRSFDLILLSFVYLVWALMMFLLGPIEEVLGRAGWFTISFISVAGVLALLSVGMLCLKNGGNYLDYDFLADIFNAHSTRRFGAMSMFLAFMLTSWSLIILYFKFWYAWRVRRNDK